MRTNALISYDVIIVGSGYGGAVCAARLAEKGMKTLVIERGPWWGPRHGSKPKKDRTRFPGGLWGSRTLFAQND
jgi:cholesterol oxidase